MAEAVTLSRYLMGGPDLQWTPLRPSHRGSLHYSFLLLFTTNSAPLLHSTLVCFSASQAKFFLEKWSLLSWLMPDRNSLCFSMKCLNMSLFMQCFIVLTLASLNDWGLLFFNCLAVTPGYLSTCHLIILRVLGWVFWGVLGGFFLHGNSCLLWAHNCSTHCWTPLNHSDTFCNILHRVSLFIKWCRSISIYQSQVMPSHRSVRRQRQ